MYINHTPETSGKQTDTKKNMKKSKSPGREELSSIPHRVKQTAACNTNLSRKRLEYMRPEDEVVHERERVGQRGEQPVGHCGGAVVEVFGKR